MAWSRPRADRGLSRPTGVLHTTIGVCKTVSRSVENWQSRAKNLFSSKNRQRPWPAVNNRICTAPAIQSLTSVYRDVVDQPCNSRQYQQAEHCITNTNCYTVRYMLKTVWYCGVYRQRTAERNILLRARERTPCVLLK